MRSCDPGPVPNVEGWDLGRLLGVGGSAQVWHATPSSGGGEPAAVKVVTLADGTAPGAARGEAALLAGLDHPHLVRLREVVPVRWPGTERAGLALVLDLAGAGSLADLLRRRGRLAPGEVVTAVAPVALALAHVHHQAFVHGDVTPANLLFDDDGVPLLADLGVAQVVGAYGEVRTTAAYADPAVAAGGRPTTASDVFMLAATAFHALTGAPPWPDPLPGVALARAARADVRPLHAALTGLPAPMAEVLVDALRPQPHLRPSAAAFALDLGRSARPLAVDFDAGRARRTDGTEVPVWTGNPGPTGERETFSVAEALLDAAPPSPSVPSRRPGRRPGRVAASPASPAGHRARHGAGGRARRRGDAAGPGGGVVGPGGAGAGPGGDPAGSRPRGGHGRRVLVACAVSCALAAAVVGAGVVVGGRADEARGRPAAAGPARPAVDGPATPSPSASSAAPSAPSSWAEVLDGLDRWRATAYADRDPAALQRVYGEHDLLTADRTTLATEVPAGCSLRGATTRYSDVQATTPDRPADRPESVVLHATASLPASVLQCPGRADVPVDGVGPTALTVTLTAADDGWRITALRAA